MAEPEPIALVEAVLFSSAQPLGLRALAHATGLDEATVRTAADELAQRYAGRASGVQLVAHGGRYLVVTSPDCAEVAGKLQREQLEGELTQPSLEALSVIAYRGPVTKAELEHLRGVNCSLIIRNLLLRGLIEEQPHPTLPVSVYVVSFDFLRHLGLAGPQELPDYARLHDDPDLADYLARHAREGGEAR